MEVVISIGGSIVASPEPNFEYIKNFSTLIKKLKDEGYKLNIVVGGGAVARRYIDASRRLGASEEYCDEVGIMATKMNAMLISAALGIQKKIPDNLEVCCEELLIMGGIKPGQTTDTVAAELAAKRKADLLINATNIDGIYDSDPKKNPNARKFKEIDSKKLLDVVSQDHKAGLTAIIDPVAAKIIHKNKIKTIVIDGRELKNIEKAIKGGDHGGTVVTC